MKELLRAKSWYKTVVSQNALKAGKNVRKVLQDIKLRRARHSDFTLFDFLAVKAAIQLWLDTHPQTVDVEEETVEAVKKRKKIKLVEIAVIHEGPRGTFNPLDLYK